MITLIYSLEDDIASRAMKIIKSDVEYRPVEKAETFSIFESEKYKIMEIKKDLLQADFIDKIVGEEKLIFVSRHESAQKVASFTVHPLGNWSSEAAHGGKSNELGFADPVRMLAGLVALSKNAGEVTTTYEVTHHGPLLKSPSYFMEVGSPPVSEEMIVVLANSVVDASDLTPEYDKIAIGIGSGHYASKFTRLALEGKYAFSHMMPKYYADEIGMLEQAIERSKPKAEIAVIEWKGLKSEVRRKVLEKLESLGVDFVRV